MQIRTLSVSELNRYIHRLLSSDPILNSIYLKGEISNFKLHGSGHAYFSLKDKTSKINCVIFKDHYSKIKFEPQNGMHILVKGYISTYERDGQYQLYIREMEPDGVGALHLAFEQLKIKLKEEGLFDCKKKIPSFPKKIAIVTSPTGAAIRDIISVSKRRSNYIDLLIYPVLVQGENAALEISNAIDYLNKEYTDIDVIIVTRGGGSIEELWAFNEEIVARSIWDSKIPIISAIGHETDYTIADFVADLRAPTPSAAAEIAVPHIGDFKNHLDNFYRKLNTSFNHYIQKKRNQMIRIDTNRLLSITKHKLIEETQRLDILQRNLCNYTNRKIQNYQSQLMKNASKLEALSPFSTILRGYSITFDENGNNIYKINQVKKGDHINIMLTDGHIDCTVTHKKKEAHSIEHFHKS
ncbi:exodeoxyribonuclease VII large subunit [Inediibacterium massiliense]|uniref:exodeoxyribonuclease VII large subunit n=1 Tax=Inediibacterium massiliense TaxID=1658111 RepID=UPI0006B5F0AC|nr:exodeoxyribonuclease VII large subunit [Inediibacterium massiliense]